MNVRRHAQRRRSSARRSSTSRPTTSSTARSASRTSSRTSRNPLSAYGRTKLDGEREVREGWIVRSSWLFGCDRAQLRADDAAARRGARRGRRSSTTSSARRPTSAHLAAATRELLELPHGRLPRRRRRATARGPSSPRRSSRRPGSTAASAGSRPPSWRGRRRAPRTRCCAASSEGAPPLPHWRDGLRECLSALRSSASLRPGDSVTDSDECLALGFGDAVLVTGGAGFIGSHFAKRLLAAGDEVVVLDKLTYSGNPANLDGAHVEFVEGDICDADAVAAAAAGCDAVVNFAAETHVDRSILGARGVHRDRRARARTCCSDWARERARGSSRSRPTRSTATFPRARSSREDDPLRPSSPYSASKAGGDLQVLAAVRTYGVDACITRGSNTYGPNQYPEKIIPLFVTNALDGEPLPLYGDGRQTRDWLHVEDHCAAVELVLREGASGRDLQRRRRQGAREPRPHAPHPRADRRRRVARPPRRGPARPRPPLLARRLEAPRRSAGRRRARSARRAGRDGRVVPRQPRLVGADQVRRLPRVLREAVRRAAGLAALGALAQLSRLVPVRARAARRGSGR